MLPFTVVNVASTAATTLVPPSSETLFCAVPLTLPVGVLIVAPVAVMSWPAVMITSPPVLVTVEPVSVVS